jgi:undecaprenyl diphosphate synthase
VRSIARDVARGKINPESIDEAVIGRYLYTADLPELDLLIRPGGEHRLSNFLLYQAAYAELVMTDVYWPEFSKDDLLRALIEFQQRQRRFGGT